MTKKKSPRANIIGVIVVLLIGLLGFALSAQLRRDDESEFSSAREGDLVQILDDLDNRRERLRKEVNDLNDRLSAVTSEEKGDQSALTEAQRRADELAILNGTVAAYGPGLTIVLQKKTKTPSADRILDAVEELRGAGAEAMQISGANGAKVRIVVSSYFIAANSQAHKEAIEVDGQVLTAPFTIVVIGDPSTISTALSIPGGVVDTVQQAGGRISSKQSESVTIDAIRPASSPRYAQPVPE